MPTRGSLVSGVEQRGRQAVAGGLHHELALEVAVDELVDRGQGRGGEHADARHEEHADHQRRRGGRGAPRVAQHVLLAQLGGDAAERRGRAGRAARPRMVATTGPKVTAPMRHSAAPTPTRPTVLPSAPERGARRSRGAGSRRRPGRAAAGRTRARPRCRAWRRPAATFEALRAGKSADSTVMPMPMTNATHDGGGLDDRRGGVGAPGDELEQGLGQDDAEQRDPPRTRWRRRPPLRPPPRRAPGAGSRRARAGARAPGCAAPRGSRRCWR